MDPRWKTVPALLMCSAAVLAGCSSGLVHREGFDAAGRIALVSVALPAVDGASRDGNRAVLAAVADHAVDVVRKDLAGLRRWSVLDASKGQFSKAMQSFGKAAEGGLVARFPNAEERSKARELFLAEQLSWSKQFVGPPGLLAVPREALLPDEELTRKDPAVRDVALQQAAALCGALQVDAVAFAHLRLSIRHLGSAFIVTEGPRTDGTASMSAALVIVDRSGRIILDSGVRPLDGRSPARDLLPVYRGAGRDEVIDENIDLADPKKKVPSALAALAEAAVADLMKDLKKMLGK